VKPLYRRASLPVVAALLATAAAALAPGATAQAPDPLVADSLAALGALVATDVCVERDAADNDTANGVDLPIRFCDDGVVPSGGGSNGIPVPVKYAADATGDDWSGLPAPAAQEEVDAADATDDLQPEDGNRITLDVDVTLPAMEPPSGGFPVIVFMHGCCGGNRTGWEADTIDAAGEKWHHSNVWFASRGYVVVTYTARGFRNANDEGSTGTTQLDSRRYEINDYQYLVGLLADHDAAQVSAGEAPVFNINPRKVAAVGGSYGGGFSWMALTDPTWTSPAEGIPIKLAAVVPKYGWTDLVEALVPSGHYYDRDPKTDKTFVAPTDPAKALSRLPIGVEKQSIVAGLYATGNLQSGNHTTFPSYVHESFARLAQGEPYDGDATLAPILESFLNDRSAYYQQDFWDRVERGLRVPLYVPATWTDPLFPTMENVRFYNKLTDVAPDYPITMYLADIQHFVANKAKEWGDLCGDDHHVCTLDDFKKADGSLGNLNRAPSRVRQGVDSKISKFLDHYLLKKGRRPQTNVIATTTICEANADEAHPVDEPGIEHRAPTWRELGPGRKVYGWTGTDVPVSSLAQDGHAAESDPVFRGQQTDKCFTTNQELPPQSGVTPFTSPDIKKTFTMMGIPTLTLEYETMATDYWIAARLFDRGPDGITLVARGVCRVNTTAAPDTDCSVFDLSGNGWTFVKGHQVVVEVTQSDTPFLRRDNFPSMVTINSANIEMPTAPKRLRHDFRD
jgi:acetyl esterase/lipase